MIVCGLYTSACRGNLWYLGAFPLSPHICFYLTGERVLCFHGPLLYEAKVCFNTTSLCVSL